MLNRSRAVAAEHDNVPQVLTKQTPATEEHSSPGKGMLWGSLISAVLWLILIALIAPLM